MTARPPNSLLDRAASVPPHVLARDVALRAGRLHSPIEAAAVLESMGMTDARAAEMGYSDLFALAEALFGEQDARGPSGAAVQVEERRRERRLDARRPLAHHAGSVLATESFAGPVVVALGATSALTYSLWAYPDPSLEHATATALATIVSLVVTAGFWRLMTWRAGLPVPGAPAASAGEAVRLLLAGLAAAAAAAGLLWAVLDATTWVEPSQVSKAALATLAFSVAWLSLGFLQAPGRGMWLLLPFLAGVATMVATRRVGRLDHFPAKMTAVLVFSGVALATGAALYAAGQRRGPGGARSERTPRAGQSRSPGWEGFVFGAALVGFLMVDRTAMLAAPAPDYPYQLVFQRDYEIGLVWALLATTPAFGVAAAASRRLRSLAGYLAEQLPAWQGQAYARALLATYRNLVLAVVAAAAAGVALAFPLGVALMRATPLLGDMVTLRSAFALAFAAASYALVAWSLVNATVLVTLGRGRIAALGAVGALAVAAAAAVPMSQSVAYWAAAAGLGAGAVVLWAVTTAGAVRSLKLAHRHPFGGL